MTDKEKLEAIVTEIKKRYNYNKEHENDWASTDHFWKRVECEELLHFIVSMDKKPKFKIGQVVRVKPMKCHGKIFIGEPNKIVDITEKEYVFDDGKSWSIELQDGWELVEEEPVNNELEEEIKRYVYDPYFDLNGVAVKGATHYIEVEDIAEIARHFAEWQNKQIKEVLRTEYEKGRHDAIEELMKTAVDGEWYRCSVILPSKFRDKYDVGHKVKMILVKEN